jgi:glycosyltransferase involved in cell wall biosynthesis
VSSESAAATPPCIAHVDSEVGFAGGEVQVFLLLEGFRRRGYGVVLICPPGSEAAREARRRGIDVTEVAMRGDADLPAVLRILGVLRDRRVGLVHLHTGRANVLGGAAAWWAGIPAVTTRRMERRVRRSYKSAAVYGRFTGATVAISPAVADCLAAGGVAADRIHLIHEAVDPARVVPVRGRHATRASLGANDDACVLLTLAALIHRKGIDVLLEALHEANTAGVAPQVWIAGEGADRATLEAARDRFGLADRVRFLGARTDVGDLLAGCDAFILPSRREGLGVAALEAMAAGRPVVCSAVGGLAHSVVHERTGLLVPPGDAAALAAALDRVVSDRALRQRLGTAGPQRIAEGFLAGQMVDAHEQLYRSLFPR